MNTFYAFGERLEFSKGIVAATSQETIKRLIPGCVSVEIATIEMDKTGVDYIATLRRGAHVFIDHKIRDRGCSHYWKVKADNCREPEIALELWSVKPINGTGGKPGWTLDESKCTHYTLHTFHPSDSAEAFLFPFQLLRKTYCINSKLWNALYPHGIQNSGRWESECVFIPVGVIFSALRQAMQLSLVQLGEYSGGVLQPLLPLFKE